jgi:hypothetical protein
MSGNAALSAARKRRASSSPISPMPTSGVPTRGGVSNQPSSYYSKNTSTVQQLMNQTFPDQQDIRGQSQMNVPPINIYENIELIKHQLTERTKIIQTQGASFPPEKLRILQKQNEIQTQILRQKMAIAQQMEIAEKQQQDALLTQTQTQTHTQTQTQTHTQTQPAPFIIPSINEPEFIYEKGIPRKNPKYKTPAEIEAMRQEAAAMASRHSSNSKANKQQPRNTSTGQSAMSLTPFVTILSDTGVIPPPVVILKAHDTKLDEHNRVLSAIIDELEELSSKVRSRSTAATNGKNESESNRADADGDAGADADADEELLMDVVINDLTNSREFVEGIVDKIVNETNLSEVIMKIEPLVKENQELRSLIYSQQQMMNEMNTMLLRLLNKTTEAGSVTSVTVDNVELETHDENYQDDGMDNDGLYEMTNIVLMEASVVDVEPATVIEDDTHGNLADTAEAVEDITPVEQDDDYDTTPHFPEHISLLIREIPSESA